MILHPYVKKPIGRGGGNYSPTEKWNEQAVILVNLAPAWNPAHQELNLDQGYSFIHMFLCMCVDLDKHSLPFLLQANLSHLKSDFDGIKEKIGLLIR